MYMYPHLAPHSYDEVKSDFQVKTTVQGCKITLIQIPKGKSSENLESSSFSIMSYPMCWKVNSLYWATIGGKVYMSQQLKQNCFAQVTSLVQIAVDRA